MVTRVDVGAGEVDEIAAGHTVASTFLDTVDELGGGQVALRERVGDGWDELTWNDYGAAVARVAGGLRAAGLQRGDRVMLMLRNRTAFFLADLGVVFAGGTPVSIYVSSSPDQVRYLSHHSQATIAIVDGPELAGRFLEVRDRLPLLRTIVVVDHEGPTSETVVPWSSLTAAAPIDLRAAAADIAPDDLATIIYTSGTTGPPKGVMISHHNVAWQVASQELVFGRRPAGFRAVSYLPMAHIAERIVTHYDALASGYQVTSCPELTQLGTYLGLVHPQLLFGVPRVWEKLRAGVLAALAADPERAQRFGEAVTAALPVRLAATERQLTDEEQQLLDFLDDVAFRQVRELVGLDACTLPITSAAPIPREVIEWFIAIGVPLFEVYGMSEFTGGITCNMDEPRLGTVGRAMPGCELRIADDGEVLGRGGNVFVGYLDDPLKTADTVDADGWLHTGDIGVLDADGYLRIVDRKKELLITAGGENVSPANLEAALKMIPLVGQAAAVGEGRPYVAALLVLDPDAAHAWAAVHGRPDAALAELAADPELRDEIAGGVDRAMAGFNNAERVKRFTILPHEWLADSEELTPTLKLKRRGVLARYAREIDDLYH
jgi:long-chain acyl-CoA synthetase